MATQTATRQQLDELDALLQKMLGTPASMPEAAKPVEPRPKTVAAPVQTVAQTPPPRPPQFPIPEVAYGVPPAAAFAASSQATTNDTPTDKRPAWAIDLNPKEGSSVLGNQRGPVQPVTPAAVSMLSVTTIPSPTPEIVMPATRAQSVAIASEVPLMLRPLAWLSDRCDATLNALPLGRIFTSPSGRTLMGYVGLAMLAASVASGALAWVGWSW
jgi:hypothetical protein